MASAAILSTAIHWEALLYTVGAGNKQLEEAGGGTWSTFWWEANESREEFA